MSDAVVKKVWSPIKIDAYSPSQAPNKKGTGVKLISALVPHELNSVSSNGTTLLYHAGTRSNCEEVVSEILKRPEVRARTINNPDKNDLTPADIMLRYGRYKAVCELFTHKFFDFNRLDSNGQSILTNIVQLKDNDAIETVLVDLLRNHADKFDVQKVVPAKIKVMQGSGSRSPTGKLPSISPTHGGGNYSNASFGSSFASGALSTNDSLPTVGSSGFNGMDSGSKPGTAQRHKRSSSGEKMLNLGGPGNPHAYNKSNKIIPGKVKLGSPLSPSEKKKAIFPRSSTKEVNFLEYLQMWYTGGNNEEKRKEILDLCRKFVDRYKPEEPQSPIVGKKEGEGLGATAGECEKKQGDLSPSPGESPRAFGSGPHGSSRKELDTMRPDIGPFVEQKKEGKKYPVGWQSRVKMGSPRVEKESPRSHPGSPRGKSPRDGSAKSPHRKSPKPEEKLPQGTASPRTPRGPPGSSTHPPGPHAYKSDEEKTRIENANIAEAERVGDNPRNKTPNPHNLSSSSILKQAAVGEGGQQSGGSTTGAGSSSISSTGNISPGSAPSGQSATRAKSPRPQSRPKSPDTMRSPMSPNLKNVPVITQPGQVSIEHLLGPHREKSPLKAICPPGKLKHPNKEKERELIRKLGGKEEAVNKALQIEPGVLRDPKDPSKPGHIGKDPSSGGMPMLRPWNEEEYKQSIVGKPLEEHPMRIGMMKLDRPSPRGKSPEKGKDENK